MAECVNKLWSSSFCLFCTMHHPIYYIVYCRIPFNSKKGMNCGYMKQCEWISKATYGNDEAILKNGFLNSVWFLNKLLLKRQTSVDRKTGQWLPVTRDCGRRWRVIEMLCIWTVVLVTWIYTCVKIHRTIYS